tara:strand:+ start:122 stop:478 length:357 start_codon:yes stop_codon:yes gene_type:complete
LLKIPIPRALDENGVEESGHGGGSGEERGHEPDADDELVFQGSSSSAAPPPASPPASPATPPASPPASPAIIELKVMHRQMKTSDLSSLRKSPNMIESFPKGLTNKVSFVHKSGWDFM